MFKSPDAALAFAFRMRHSAVISIPSVVNIANKTDKQHSSERLTQYDLHAQVGMLFSWLSRRPEDEQIYAFYLHGSMRERRLAASLLIRRNLNRLRKYGLSNHDLKQAILSKSIRDIAEKVGMTKHKAWNFRRELADILMPTQERLMNALWEYIDASNTHVVR